MYVHILLAMVGFQVLYHLHEQNASAQDPLILLRSLRPPGLRDPAVTRATLVLPDSHNKSAIKVAVAPPRE